MEVAFMRDKIPSLEEISKLRNGGLEFELKMSKESEKKAWLKVKSLLGDIELLQTELRLALEGEEKSREALEDLALALKEVATEANEAKEKLSELEHVKKEVEQLKLVIRNTDETHQKLLDEARQDVDMQRNTAERLRLEAEETLLAWNAKEMGFVSCIKRAEDEKATAQHERNKLSESLMAAENSMRVAKEENYKLRDILKQAISESNAATAAAGIARDENSQLKDCLSEKEEVLHFLTRENERLRINEAAAKENVKEFKKLLSNVSTELRVEDCEGKGLLSPQDQEHESKERSKNFSFCLEDLKFLAEPDYMDDRVLDEDPEKTEALKGSIFDTNAETPTSEPHTPQPFASHQRGYSSPFTKEDLDQLHDDSDTDRTWNRRKKTMFRRVGDLLTIRRSFGRKESSLFSPSDSK